MNGLILKLEELKLETKGIADLNGADLDYSCWPLWCGSLGVHIDDRLAIQLLYHLIYNVNFSKNISQDIKDVLLTDEIIELANRFHRVNETGKIEKSLPCGNRDRQ